MDAYQVMGENEYVRIVVVNIDAGQTPPKYAPASKVVVRVDLNSHGAVHYSENYEESASPAKAAVREIRTKIKGAPAVEPIKLDAVRVDPARYRVMLENDRVRVVRLGFGPLEKGMMVTHPPRVLITLTDVAVKLLFADGRTDERGAPAGVAAWLETETLQTENAKDSALEVVLVEPKSSRGF